MKKRFLWIDNLRGLMIVLVAMGHIIVDGSVDNTFNSIMRMPTFFMISGFLFKFKPKKDYFVYKLKSLIIPYFIYLIPILAIQMYLEDKSLMEYFVRLILGGPYTYSWTGVFWFITCLFFTQQVFNLFKGFKDSKIAIIMIVFLMIAYINQFYFNRFNIPWNINVCFYTCPLFFMGYLFKKYGESVRFSWFFSIPILIFIYLLSTFLIEGMYTRLNNTDYGFPVLGFIFSVISAFCMVTLFKTKLNFKLFSVIGKASLVIMYLHLPIRYAILYYDSGVNQWYILAIAVLLPILIYYLLRRNLFTKKYFLGEA
ncbi:acyltransferase family protein [Flavobacterium sp. ASW18X]|uniref:acyltransferase family protein n=1 Tax=Flavobacterium sp. ASW18X TaxID=2572595 RepID=UPI0010AE99EB|nr:acyltransferase family protein [Flavobacterium sp. ASW18X]TKD65544.1 hypothetical protein FBT53_05350 [Flavobacterium sp. ASW18X]